MLAGYRGLQLQPKQYLQPRLEQMNLWAFSRNGPCSYCKGLIILFPPSAQVTLIHKKQTQKVKTNIFALMVQCLQNTLEHYNS